MTERCQYKIRLTFGQDAQCERDHHIDQVIIKQQPDGMFSVFTVGDGVDGTERHTTRIGQMEMHWTAGDRREFTGDWPGPCEGKIPGCVLPSGHHGNCAP